MANHRTGYIKSVWMFFIAVCSSITMNAQTDSTFDIYLLIGQSNMAGRGVIAGAYSTAADPNVVMLDRDNKWVPAKHPLHFDKPAVAGVGPGLSFGIWMAKANPGHKIGLIPCAVGGTSINVWIPGAYDSATKTHPYDDMMQRLEPAIRAGVIKGVIWLQGESDSKPERSAAYLDKLKALIQRLRLAMNDASMPFVAGELGRFREQFQNINKVLQQLPGLVSNTAVASSDKLNDKGDETHFDSESAEEMGKRFAEKMQEIQRQLKNNRNK